MGDNISHSLEEYGIRFPEDMPIILPCLRRAFDIARIQRSNNPYVLEALLYFFSYLVADSYNNERSGDAAIFTAWDTTVSRVVADSILTPLHSHDACRKAEDIIEQLDPLATYRELQSASDDCMSKAIPYAREEQGFAVLDRGDDWIIRCAYELDLTTTWRRWLYLMYKKQPCETTDPRSFTIDDPERRFYNSEPIFLDTISAAERLHGIEATIPLIKFWLRQTLTLVEIWSLYLTLKDDQDEMIPTHDWFVCAYQKMSHRFHCDVRDPFSEYPYTIRQDVLGKLSYLQVFEQCWGWVSLASQTTTASEFDPFEVRLTLHNDLLNLVRSTYHPQEHRTTRVLEESFGVQNTSREGGYQLLAESPIVNVNLLDSEVGGYGHLIRSILEIFNPLPSMEGTEDGILDYRGYDSVEDYESAFDDDIEMDLAEDVELEAHGPPINIAQFTVDKEPAEDAFCTFCQEQITSAHTDDMRCIKPTACSDVFHAKCLDSWVNSTSGNSNRCPNCKVQMTVERRLRRQVRGSG
ncbi:hypothetical protein OPT61_g1366 [Boeremia exigua]|uniref:Uncharacterized protein n=1 Tax=Boeremia exigua TaxID=749465 RepID=A0ACC2IQL5_9PLEO|nr:hypothetical protein OPT61_g1366 [Boeremia exigua]